MSLLLLRYRLFSSATTSSFEPRDFSAERTTFLSTIASPSEYLFFFAITFLPIAFSAGRLPFSTEPSLFSIGAIAVLFLTNRLPSVRSPFSLCDRFTGDQGDRLHLLAIIFSTRRSPFSLAIALLLLSAIIFFLRCLLKGGDRRFLSGSRLFLLKR